MKRLMAVLVVGVALLWTSAAFAQYSALEDAPTYGPWIGAGGLLISGNNAAGDGDSEFIPTVNIGGMTDYLAWQGFYGFGADSTVIGGSVDYIVANNFDECFSCVDGMPGMWWFGVGGTLMDVSDLYYDDGDSTAAMDDTLYGPNLGFGYTWDAWMFNLYAHYLMGDEDQMAFQATIMYNFMQ